jgi:hypothetical protein
LKGQENYII